MCKAGEMRPEVDSRDEVMHSGMNARPRPRPIFGLKTGLVLRPTVSDNITVLLPFTCTTRASGKSDGDLKWSVNLLMLLLRLQNAYDGVTHVHSGCSAEWIKNVQDTIITGAHN